MSLYDRTVLCEATSDYAKVVKALKTGKGVSAEMWKTGSVIPGFFVLAGSKLRFRAPAAIASLDNREVDEAMTVDDFAFRNLKVVRKLSDWHNRVLWALAGHDEEHRRGASANDIAGRLNAPAAKVRQALMALVKKGLAKKSSAHWRPGDPRGRVVFRPGYNWKNDAQVGATPVSESLQEYGGIGGRVAGGRHPYAVPPSNIVTRRDMTPERIEKRKRELQQRAEVRERLRQIAIEGRRPLKTLGG